MKKYSADAYQIDKANELLVGKHYDVLTPTFSYRVHAYKDGWHCLWHGPVSATDIGRLCKDSKSLREFMENPHEGGELIKGVDT